MALGARKVSGPFETSFNFFAGWVSSKTVVIKLPSSSSFPSSSFSGHLVRAKSVSRAVRLRYVIEINLPWKPGRKAHRKCKHFPTSWTFGKPRSEREPDNVCDTQEHEVEKRRTNFSSREELSAKKSRFWLNRRFLKMMWTYDVN